jgi:hypothetical protein
MHAERVRDFAGRMQGYSNINMRIDFSSHVFRREVSGEGAVILALRYSGNGSEKNKWG